MTDTRMSIRVATLADCQLIHDMAWQVFPETYQDIISPAQIAYMMEQMYSIESLRRQMTEERQVYLIACRGDESLGYVSVQPQDKDLWHLQKIYVLSGHQKEHVGKFLFCQAVAYIRCHQQGSCRMELNVNRHNPALGFYRHLGMRVVRTEDNDIGNGFFMNDYVMGMDIA